MKSLTYVEIDVPTFVEESPAAVATFRFTQASDYLPADIEAIPSITGISFSPATISLGQNLGQRASLSVTFQDHRHIFASETFESGTFWGKWRARYGARLRGRAFRWISGILGQSLAEMETRHFVVESVDGPTPQGTYTIVAKDVLKLTDGDRAQAPLLSNGFLVAGIDDNDTAATLTPSGIGNAEYPASGYIAIGGEEIVAFTRSGDALTITRAQFNTAAVAHDAGARAQICLHYNGVDPADIIADLLENYAGVPSDYIPLAAWQTETDAYLQRVYSALIAEPTSVNDLVSELIEQAALAVWWDPLTQLIRLQVLRPITATAAAIDETNTMEGSLAIQEQPDQRISQVWTYFGQRNPLEPIDEPNNFRSTALTIDADSELEYGVPAIKKIFSRWIPFGGRNVATRLNDIVLGRYRDPPRKFGFEMWRHGPEAIVLGGGFRISAWPLQDMTGAPVDAPIQITRLNYLPDRYRIEAEEALFQSFDPDDLVDRVIILDADAQDINLRSIHDSLYPTPTVGDSPEVNLTCVIETSVIIGASSTSARAFDVGSWPSGFPILLRVLGRIQGAGGAGGDMAVAAGGNGGLALYTRHAITLEDGSGMIAGGGGGGGRGRFQFTSTDLRGGGGGGAGRIVGAGGVVTGGSSSVSGSAGTLDAGGAGGVPGPSGSGGIGGGPGLNGAGGSGNSTGAGGSAGAAIDGISFIAQSGPAGDRRGPEVN
jgi:hypothetical protein